MFFIRKAIRSSVVELSVVARSVARSIRAGWNHFSFRFW